RALALDVGDAERDDVVVVVGDLALQVVEQLASMMTTGSSSRTAAFSSPLASAGVAGVASLRPGKCAYEASSACECCAASCSAAPVGPRKTIGHLNLPAVM